VFQDFGLGRSRIVGSNIVLLASVFVDGHLEP